MTTLKSKYSNTLVRPRITEKATLVQQSGAYVFEVSEEADKKSVAEAVKAFYGVTPVKVAIARNPAKKIFFRGKHGKSGGVKKAYVYLKEGDAINLS